MRYAHAEEGPAGCWVRSSMPPASWGSPWASCNVVAEMPIFVFTSLLLECNHLQGMYSQAQEGTFTESLVCQDRRGHTKTNEPTSLWELWVGRHGSRSIPGPPHTCPCRGCQEAQGAGQGLPRRGGWAHRVSGPGQAGLAPKRVSCGTRGSLGPLGKGLLMALLSCSLTAPIKGTIWLFECVLTFHQLRME